MGLAATLGGGWQLEGIDFAFGRGVALGPIRHVSAGGRIGYFLNQSQVIGSGQGIIGAASLAGRTGKVPIIEVGNDQHSSSVGLDLTFEATGYLAAHSPLPQGGSWVALSALPGLRFGEPRGSQWGVIVGPTVFLGHGHTNVHTFVGIRFEMPLARGEGRP